MVFSSITFLFLFLPLVLVVYHVCFMPVTLGYSPLFWRRICNTFLLLVSLLFYFWGEGFLVWILLASTFVDYVCGWSISRRWRGHVDGLPPPGEPRTRIQKLALTISICSNLGFLGYFKYRNFAADAYSDISALWNFESFAGSGLELILPLGISFYTFQSMSYTIDVYRGQVKATRNLLDFACYVTMFPQLVAGPIVRYRDVAQQLITRKVQPDRFATGVTRFVFGLSKKVLIADSVGSVADSAFALTYSELSPGVAWLGLLAYSLQIYFDFSGYSDMAIGLGRMFGFEFLENFNYPYMARSVRDFWRRWHISLSTWFRDYLYVPLGGSRGSKANTHRNLFVVFAVCGLWHGASMNFVCWGLWHGLFLVSERSTEMETRSRKFRPFEHAYTLLAVAMGWVLFRCDTFSHALDYYVALFGNSSSTPKFESVLELCSPEFQLAVFMGIVCSFPIQRVWFNWYQSRLSERNNWGAVVCQSMRVLLTTCLLIACAASLASKTYHPFIYFRF